MWFAIARVLFVTAIAYSALHLGPLGDSALPNVAFGTALGLAFVLIEVRLQQAATARLLATIIGGAIGLAIARAAGAEMPGVDSAGRPLAFLRTVVLLALPYLGATIGARRGTWLEPARLIALFRKPSSVRGHRVLDTSVIIDGRVADVCEAGFLDGTLVVPQFVLRELQLVADSSDALTRNRGRRGLDILQRMQKMAGVEVIISDADFPGAREVDQKLIELTLALGGKIVTNDFNLNKVAQLRGVEVLNINELANALKPVVLPGEYMTVLILKQGKDYTQGVGYLDDGTMVVVDNGSRAIGRTIDIVVTSVLQTTAGRMIFGRYLEHAGGERTPHAADREGPRLAAADGGLAVGPDRIGRATGTTDR